MLIHPEFDPVLLNLGKIQVHWYGVMYLLGFSCAYLLGKHWVAKGRTPFKSEHIDDVVFYGALGVILGGRIGYVLFYNFQSFLNDPISIVKVWQGGMSFPWGLHWRACGAGLFVSKVPS